MKDYIEERVLELALYVVENRATVRETAKVHGISKSTVHKDLSERLKFVKPGLVNHVRAVLEENKAERHIRGGLATKEKFLNCKKKA